MAVGLFLVQYFSITFIAQQEVRLRVMISQCGLEMYVHIRF